MKIGVVIRQVPDLIEPLEIGDSGTELDFDETCFIVNEYDEHALEQAICLKESFGAEVTAVALDFGDVDQTLYAAAAKGADRIIKVPYEEFAPPTPMAGAKIFARALMPLQLDLVLVGAQSSDELAGNLAPLLALQMELPYAGVIQGVEQGDGEACVTAFKEYPGAAKARLKVNLPALLGILTASQPPRYVPISRIRAAMNSVSFDEQEIELPDIEHLVSVQQLRPPEVGERAEILEGSEEAVSERVVAILQERGVLK